MKLDSKKEEVLKEIAFIINRRKGDIVKIMNVSGIKSVDMKSNNDAIIERLSSDIPKNKDLQMNLAKLLTDERIRKARSKHKRVYNAEGEPNFDKKTIFEQGKDVLNSITSLFTGGSSETEFQKTVLKDESLSLESDKEKKLAADALQKKAKTATTLSWVAGIIGVGLLVTIVWVKTKK
jgi:hypothetical protein